MSTEQTRSRRQLLAGAGAGLAAAAAAALTHPARALADDGDAVLVGGTHTGNTRTRIENTTDASNAAAIIGVSAAGVGVIGGSTSGQGVIGSSESSAGVQGHSNTDAGVSGFGVMGVWATGERYGVQGGSENAGIFGHGHGDPSGTGVLGYSSPDPDPSHHPNPKSKTGVYGHAILDAASRGVWGRSNAGRGVYGEARGGVGVYGSASTGYAFRGSGRLRFDKVTGVATIAAGSKTVTVTPGVEVTGSSFVLLTPKANIGSRALWFTTDDANNRFTIRMSAARTSATAIAWLLLG